VVLEPATLTIMQNTSVEMEVTVRDSAGAIIEDAEVTWSSPDYPTVFASGGYVVGSNPGVGRVIATSGGKSDTSVVTILIAPVQTINVGPINVVLLPGETAQLTSQTKDARGAVLTGRAVTWTSNNALATVSATGVVSAVSAGLASITATSEGASITVPIRVIPNVITYDYFKRGGTTTPATATLNIGAMTNGRHFGTLTIDGQSLAVGVYTDSTGVYCMLGATAPGPIMSCGYNLAPSLIALCNAPNGFDQPRVLQYVLFPQGATDRVPATASALIASIPTTMTERGIEVLNCGNSQTPTWLRTSTGGFILFPNTTTVYPESEVAGRLEGALVYSTPGAGSDFTRYVALRIGPGLFELWH
jgi:hypothetical protein